MNEAFAVFRAMLAKDLVRELRSREFFISGFLFSIILLCAIYFSMAANDLDHRKIGGGALWLCIIFSGTIGLNRTHQSEMVNGCYRALMLAPIDGGWLFLAKYCANFILLGLMVLLLIPLLMLFFQLPPTIDPVWLAASLFLGVSGFVAIGTLIVVITANTRMKDVLFPIIQLPLVVPILIAGVNSTTMAIDGESSAEWIRFLAALNLVFLSVGFMLYEFLLEE